MPELARQQRVVEAGGQQLSPEHEPHPADVVHDETAVDGVGQALQALPGHGRGNAPSRRRGDRTRRRAR